MTKSISIHSSPFVSIAIPATDMRVLRAIRSILNAGRNYRLEIIIVFNNCDPRYVKELQVLFPKEVARRTMIIIHLPKSTIGGARNAAVAASHGTYIVHMDSDCEMLPDYFDHLGNLLEQNILIARGETNFIGLPAFFDRANCALKNLVYHKRKGICYTPNLIVRASLNKKFPFDATILYGEDNELSIRLGLNGIAPIFSPSTKMNHIDYADTNTIFKKYFLYGIARNYRLRKWRRDANAINYYKKLFGEVPQLDNFPIKIRLGILALYVIRNIGVLYGLCASSIVQSRQ